MRRLALLLLSTALAMAGFTVAAPRSGAATPPPALVTVIQAVPGATITVSVDGRRLAAGAGVGDVLGPFEVAPGTHNFSFTGGGVSVETAMELKPGAVSDVVLHLPADVGGDPVVHSYAAPDGPIGPGKARVMLAHTATVAPADVQVDGQIVFTNIANGEYADADVPAGTIKVALLPSGTTQDPILGPLDVSLTAGTLSMIYAYGNPRDHSMSVIAHTAELASDGSVQPSLIDTGSAGLVDDPVRTFGARVGPGPDTILLWTLGMVVAAAMIAAHRARRRSGSSAARRHDG